MDRRSLLTEASEFWSIAGSCHSVVKTLAFKCPLSESSEF